MERSKVLVIVGLSACAAILILVVILIARIASQPLQHLQRPADPQSATIPGDTIALTDEEVALKAAEPIDPATIGYHEIGSFPVAFREPRALAVDGKAEIHVGGDRAVVRYSSDGKKLAEIALQGESRCLAVGALDHLSPGQLYVGMENHVEVYNPHGTRVAVWESRGPKAIFSSIATTENEVWVADAGNRLVWRFDVAGKLLEPVGQTDPSQHRSRFLVTNHYFDLVAGTDDLVYVVNPRLLQIEGFTHKGEHETSWGKGSPAVADFFGCCNPAQLAVLPDGRFVTAEKGMPRVKIYSRDGHFQTVVVGPPQLTDTPTDLATDRHGRVLVLDGRAAKVRVFEKNVSSKGEKK
ncbi:MAG: NHL repeat-containing protein [Planctomycetota bacterium]